MAYKKGGIVYPRQNNGQFIKGFISPFRLNENEFKCLVCGKEFRRRGQKKHTVKFCSVLCKNIGISTGFMYKEVNGYINMKRPNHPRASKFGYVKAHILIVEKVLGKPLPNKVLVHHHDKNPSNNSKTNLIVCENESYHHLLHKRMRAKKACGHPNWEFCRYCKVYEPQETLKSYPSRPKIFFHIECERNYKRQQKRKSKCQDITKKTGKNLFQLQP